MIFDQVSAVTSPVVTAVVLKEARPSLLDLYGGANAAYSLRELSIAWEDQDVVEVRRASDDTTSGFTATEVTDGTMEQWVNATVALPLDTASGAAAAYSLRDLKDSPTSFTSSGDTDGDTSGAWVVQARRDSDDALKSFTAADVADGSLEDWVTGTFSNATFVNTDYETFSGASASGFTAGNTAGTSFASSDLGRTFVAGETVRVEFDLTVTAGSSPLVGIRATQTGTFASNSISYTTSGSKSIDLTLTANGQYLVFSEGDFPSDFTVSNLTVSLINGNGYVSKWYDQSGNNNHGTQTTVAKQPRIVADGAQVFENSVPAIRPDGVDDAVNIPTISGDNYSVFAKYHAPSDSSLIFRNTGGNATAAGRRSNTHWYFQFDGTTYDQAVDHPSTPVVANYQVIGTDMMIRGNGVDVWTPQTVTAGTNSNISRIANYLGGTGTVSEVIIYTTDQTDNRKALESNMAEFYGVDLDAAADHDSGEDQVDGFVTTWYDQSGQGNDAVQAVATSQPKIVEAGSLVTRGASSKPSISFGVGQDKNLDIAGRPYARSAFSPLEASTTNYETLICDTNDSTPRITTNNVTNNRKFTFVGFGTPSVNINGSTYDGTTQASAFGFALLALTSDTGGEINRIGANSAAGATGNSLEYVSELIIYGSDQSSNRTGIEGNINTEYNIYP